MVVLVVAALAALSCRRASVSPPAYFPDANGASWQATPLDFGDAVWRDYAIAPDRASIFALVVAGQSNGSAAFEMWVFDPSGQRVRTKALRPYVDRATAELFFTDRGELVWNDDAYFHFIDPATLDMTAYPQCRVTAYPLLADHKKAAEEQAAAWRATELAAARRRLGLADDAPTTGPQASPELAAEIRRLHNATNDRTQQLIADEYAKVVAAFAARTTDPVGLEIELQGGAIVQDYVRLDADGVLWYFDLPPTAPPMNVQWSRLRPAAGVKVLDRHVGLGLSPHFIDDGGVHLAMPERIHTRGSSWVVTDPPVYDYILEVKGLGGATSTHRMRFKDDAPDTARDFAVRLADGTLVLDYMENVYLLRATGS